MAQVLSLRRKRDLDRLFSEGRRVHSAAVVLHARRREAEEGPPMPRVAVMAGRRFSTAVARNRARRVLREACRIALGERRVSWDLILVARPEALQLPHSARLDLITELLHQAGVLEGKAAGSA